MLYSHQLWGAVCVKAPLKANRVKKPVTWVTFQTDFASATTKCMKTRSRGLISCAQKLFSPQVQKVPPTFPRAQA